MARACFGRVHPGIAMIFVQIVFGGINIVYKLVINDGMSIRVAVAYRLLFGAAFLCPIALIVESSSPVSMSHYDKYIRYSIKLYLAKIRITRSSISIPVCIRNKRPKLTWVVFTQIFFLALFGGSVYHNLYLASLNLTSMTFAAAMYNLSPAFTYIVAVLFRMETLSVNNARGIAKVAGTAVCIGGAMLLTFYKGVEISIWHTNIDLLKYHHQKNAAGSAKQEMSGLAIALIACVFYALWVILQAKINKNYPCFYSSTALMSLMGSIQAIIYALCFERKWSDWKLESNIRLISVIYLGILASGLNITLMAWCIAKRGPLYVAIFNPLMLLVVALAGSLVFQEKLHLGSILGGVLIIAGLYTVLWGKSKSSKSKNQPVVLPNNSDQESPGIAVTSQSEVNNF
ncbi:WAT1-RELATED PROTEIN [Salix purpurea]|uniref:WAT1-related protein n=1 Tax=Salix purpurea TaxID=77065 RepID=A0A9Q0VTU4_SALPP|nr:WAT1-RELATED PROTEIN [Salix purpurea]